MPAMPAQAAVDPDRAAPHRPGDPLAARGADALLGAIEAQVLRAPQALAIADMARDWSYAALWEAVERMAARLRAAGLRPGDRALCVAGRGAPTVVALLAIWRVGGVYVPVKDDYPAARIEAIREQSGAVLTIGCEPRAARDAHGEVVPGEIAVTAGVARDVGPPCEPAAGDALAYVIYTSGSTGAPKGVMVGHAALRNVIDDHLRVFALSRADRVLQFSSPAFDAALFQILMPLCCGAVLVLADEATLGDVARLLARVEQTGVSVLSLPPAYLARFERRPLPACVRLLNTGGDAPVVADARHYAGCCDYFSTYGPTEATICCAHHRVDPRRDYAGGVPLGQPVDNMRLAVFDAQLRPVEPGETGELLVSGVGLAFGYVGEPEKTVRAFVELPADDGGEGRTVRWYRTGDRVREQDGELFFAGRADRQVKISGYRIELAEIERALERHPAVTRSLVERIAGPDGRNATLHAYLQGEPGAGATAAVRASLAASLPAYMIPATLSWVARFPLTSNGKIDTKALAALRGEVGAQGQGGFEDESSAVAMTPFRLALAGIWRRALKLPDHGPRGHFFAAGGDSLIGMRVTAEVERRLGCETSVADLLRTPAFDDYAALLESRPRRALPADERVSGPTGEDACDGTIEPDAPWPLTPAQRRLWMLGQIEPASSAYHLAHAFVLRGPLDTARLQRALDAVVRRHPALRAAIVERRGIACQQPRDGTIGLLPLRVPEIDRARRAGIASPHDATLEAALHAARTAADAPFDPAHGPLVRMAVARLDADRALLLCVVHHLVCDGTSLGIVLDDLGRAYRAPDAAPPLPVHDYRQLIERQAARLQRRLPALAGFWQPRVTGLPEPLALPADFPRPARRGSSGEVLRFDLDAALGARLARAAADHGVSRFSFVLAVFKVLLHRYTERDDLVVGVPVTERHDARYAQAVGMFVNTVIVRTRLTAALPFRALLARVADECAQVYAHGDYPFDLLVEQSDAARDPAHGALFNVMAAWQCADDLRLTLDGVELERHVPLESGSKFDLSIDFVDGPHGLQILLEYSDALFTAPRIARLFAHWCCLLDAALADPDLPLARLNLLPPDERMDLERRFQAPRLVGPAPLALDGFDATVRAELHRSAIVHRGRHWSYAEIDRQVSALAAVIGRRLAGAPNRLVGILVERSERFFVSLLAIWRAGHAYLPLDAQHPDARLRQIVEASGCVLIVADRALAPRAPADRAPLLCYDEADPDGALPLPVAPALQPDRLAYCYFTSGSTGQPKGVLVEHGNVANAIRVWRRDYALDQPRVLQLAGHAFDVALGDLCRSLLIGGTLVIADEVERASPPAIAALLEAERIDVCEITPAVARLLTSHFQERAAPPGLRLLVVGSDVWTLDEFAALRARLAAQTRLIGSYGTTEATVDSTCYEPAASDVAAASRHDGAGERVPLGRPMSNVEVRICDRAGNLMPIGVPGELCLAGPSVARGYLGWPSPDGERFVADPPHPGARVFRTRDRAAWRADGSIAFLGRADDQLKVRGYRIDRVEIEQALRAVPGVAQAVVAVHAGAGRLMAFVTGAAAPRAEVIRAAVAAHLPFFAVPESITVLARLPLNVNGKVAVKQLEALESQAPAAGGGAGAPLPPRQALLAQLWREVLRAPGAIDASSSFFGLGGDSLQAVSLVIAAARVDARLTLADIYRQPRLADMAACLRPGRAGTAPPLVVPPVGEALRRRLAGQAVDLYPATQMQAAMLDWSRRNPASYHNQSSWRLRAPGLTAALAGAAVAAVAAHYPALRTAFVRDPDAPGGYVQVVLAPEAMPLVIEDLSPLDGAARQTRLAGYLAADRERPFAVGAASDSLVPMSRAAVFELGGGEVELIWSQHHALDDGWSHLQIEARLLAYGAQLLVRAAIAPEPPDTSYREVVALEREQLASTELVAYWRARCAGWALDGEAGGTASGTASPARAEPAPRPMRQHLIALDAAVLQALRQRAAALGVSLKSLFVAAFHRALGEWRPPWRPVIGIVSNGRSARMSNPLGMVGLCWNLVPFHRAEARLGAQAAFDELAAIESHAGLPLPAIARLAGRPELLDACLNFTDFPRDAAANEAAIEVAARGTTGCFHFPVTLTVALRGDGAASCAVLECDAGDVTTAGQDALGNLFLGALQR
ncbi:non-ribosomal peptide synthetase [Burkholderia plantarii]|uniref:non-ribosomal peptide synthetase n=1 Tax=Burkholderia plantarii TaxID=41899 RepID=UPI0018DD3ABC|nr:non-ribosomal peptide synthetase [Burkholderia plantarii]MBI0330563.1 amino acid adenylation domain-containing protein [Burkholderia plantarii]